MQAPVLVDRQDRADDSRRQALDAPAQEIDDVRELLTGRDRLQDLVLDVSQAVLGGYC
jgi:hypothetical protein